MALTPFIVQNSLSLDVSESEVFITPIFPLNDDQDVDFDVLDCTPSGEVHIAEDEELGNSLVVELCGNDSRITFFTQTDYRYLVVFLNACSRFCSVAVIINDDHGNERFIEVSNRRSTVTVENNTATKIPMEVKEGWQRICLDLQDIVQVCFGTNFSSCLEVSAAGGCRLYKVFLQAEDYAEPQLPTYLRVLKT